MSKSNTPQAPYKQMELPFTGRTDIYVHVDEIETSPHQDLLNVTIGIRFLDLMKSTADRLTWPVTRAQTEKLTREELVRRRFLEKESDPYMMVAGPTPEDDNPQMYFALSSSQVVNRLCMVIGANTARQIPTQKLVAAITGGVDPFAERSAMIALEHREAA